MNLTDELRIKVAEACGWKIKNTAHYNPPCKLWEHPEWGVGMEEEDLPNYPQDLNACSSFEQALTDEEHLRYRVQLWNVVITEGDETTWDRQFISATARQRCLAYLKVKGILP